jgi:DNA modification methylase
MARNPKRKKPTTAPAAKMTVEEIPLDQINFAVYNPRKKLRKSDQAYQDIRASIAKYGMVQNCVWNRRSGNLVGGHQRILVGKAEFDWTSAPCFVVDLDDDDERALNLILNKVGEGNWDSVALRDLLEEIRNRGKIDIYTLGFTPVEVEELLKVKDRPTKRDPDDAPDPPAKAQSKPGDHLLFIMADGKTQHHLWCASSTDLDTFRRIADTAKPARMVFTDPPYGVTYVSQARGKKMKRHDLQNDELRDTVLRDFLQKAFEGMTLASTRDAVAYIFYASKCHGPFHEAFTAAGWEERQQLIWIKQLVLGRSHYHWAHEPLFYVGRKGGKVEWFGDRAQKTFFDLTDETIASMKKEELVSLLTELRETSTIIDVQRDPPSSYVHPTQKPIKLVQRAARNSTILGDTIIDPFGGSGSTLIGSEIAQRNSVTVELDPVFADVIAQRAVETFEEIVVVKNGTEINPRTLIVSTR